MSHITEVKTIQMVTRQQVLKLLGWDELQYGDFLMQQADVYLVTLMGADSAGINKLKASQSFWAWFKNHWHRRNMRFVSSAKRLNSRIDREHLYILTHDGETINFKPHSAIMREALPVAGDVVAQLYDEMELHLKKAEELAHQITKIQERNKK